MSTQSHDRKQPAGNDSSARHWPVSAWLALSICLYAEAAGVPILAYHRFNTTVADSMTVRVEVFEMQLRYLREHGYQIVPLRQVLASRQPGGKPLPPKAVAITADDGHRSIYEQLWPLVQRYRFPVTLFIYPSAISHASYAMSWAQLDELHRSGWFDIQSHTYWHPNFKQEKRRLPPDDYLKFVRRQLSLPKQKLEQRFGQPVELLAWPFGIYDPELQREAAAAGYVAAFSIDAHGMTAQDNPYALPRYLMVDRYGEKAFAQLLAAAAHDDEPAKAKQP